MILLQLVLLELLVSLLYRGQMFCFSNDNLFTILMLFLHMLTEKSLEGLYNVAYIHIDSVCS